MKRVIYILFGLIISFFMFLFFLGLYLTGPVSKESKEITFEVKRGDAYSSIASRLKESNLIKSEFMYKLYVKLENPTKLEVCVHNLNSNLNLSDLITKLSQKCNANPDSVRVTIPEGKNLEQVAEIISKSVNKSKSEIFSVWTSDKFVDEAIAKYDFLTSDVKNNKVRYALEGYLFPSTYELLNKDVSAEYIAYKMLDQMDKIYKKYLSDIKNSEYSFHKIMTMASLVEYEAILDEDRALVAGVFYNRVEAGDRFGSCATLGYAIDEWKITYTYSDMQVDSPYNTYKYSGFPPGPGGMPGEKSIIAAIKPTDTNYYYFMANVCDVNDSKTYFSVTLAEHDRKSKEMLTCFR